jgi:CRP/FNR family cyclic AMP-dependent transcriptional regulator
MPVDPDPFAHPALSGLLRTLARRGAVRRYRRGSVLIHEGEQGDTLFIVLSGRLRAFATGEGGREITYGVYGPGEYLGEMSLDGGPRSASVATLEDSVCAMVTRQTLTAFIAERPEFAFDLLAKVIGRARAATLTARQLALNDVYGRLRLLLIDQSEAAGDSEDVRHMPQRLTHLEMAQRLGCTREMISRLMKQLELGEYVASEGEGLRILRRLPPRW